MISRCRHCAELLPDPLPDRCAACGERVGRVVEALLRPDPWRWRRIACLLLAIFPGLPCLAMSGYMVWLHPGQPSRPFTPAAWRAANAEHRGQMLDDLRDKHALVGMTRSQIEALLGPADDPDGPAWMRYCVGYRGGRKGAPFVFPYDLNLSFDSRGICTAAYLSD